MRAWLLLVLAACGEVELSPKPTGNLGDDTAPPDDCGEQTIEFFLDEDGDSYGAAGASIEACEAPDGYARNGTDCDDLDPTTYPGAVELCDLLDNDCDEQVDDAAPGQVWLDEDGDGFGDPDTTVEGCPPDDRYVSNAEDCDDGDRAIHPDAEEVCDHDDNDCDGS